MTFDANGRVAEIQIEGGKAARGEHTVCAISVVCQCEKAHLFLRVLVYGQ